MKETETQAKLSLKLQAYQYLKTKILNCEYRPNEFLNELGDGRYADVQLFGKLRERTLPVHRHMCDDISLEEVVLVRNTFQIVIFLSAEKFG